MKKITLSAKGFNALKRNPSGPKVQRIWISDLKGLGVDLGKMKKSFILKYKSPENDKQRILSIESYSYQQTLDKN